jgi:uracil-DNA glycosylase family 4
LADLEQAVPKCRRCPDLRAWCTEVGRKKRRAYADWDYWAKPVPSFGDRRAGILIVGLAPGAHGANRTGRIFTGDRSGDFLYAALHRVGLANQPESVHRGDGLKLRGVYITAALHCAPPANKPTPAQVTNCSEYLEQELAVLRPAVTMCLGTIAWKATLAALAEGGSEIPRPRPAFGHGVECPIGDTLLVGCYHVSQQNTFTGRLTEPMLDAVLARAKEVAAR